MNKIFRTALAGSIALALAACGSSNDNDDDPVVDATTFEITGQAVKGIFAGALVEVFNAQDLTTAIGSDAQTDETGNYTVTITDADGGSLAGAYVVQVSADDDSTMVCDASVCGDLVRGELIPAEDLTGLTLSTFIYSDGTGSVEADVNALTTMATDTILAAVSVNENIDLANVTLDGVTSLQLGGSQVLGSMLGLDLSATNIYDVDIVDASVSADVPTDSAIVTTLNLINASFTGLNTDAVASLNVNAVADFSNSAFDLGSVIAEYLSTFKAIVALLVVPDADLTSVSAAQLAIINNTQTQFATLVAELVAEIQGDTGVEFEIEEILIEIDLQEIIDIIAEIDTSGATGGDNP